MEDMSLMIKTFSIKADTARIFEYHIVMLNCKLDRH